MAEIMKVVDVAKKIMRQSGNMHQWGEGYPSEAVITTDMERNGGFLVEDNGMIVGYFAFLPSPEPRERLQCPPGDEPDDRAGNQQMSMGN